MYLQLHIVPDPKLNEYTHLPNKADDHYELSDCDPAATMALDQPYEKLDENENDDYTPGRHINDIPPPPKPMSKRKQFLYVALWTIVVIALTAVVVRSTTRKAAPASTPEIVKANITSAPLEDVKEPIDPVDPIQSNKTTSLALGIVEGCGSTPDEARAAGCVFDVMMQLWTPEACYDGNLSERFLAAGKWTWWADAGATRTLSDEEMKLGEHDRVYVSADYHKSHCIFAWEKLVRALRNQTPLIEQLISVDHAMHCQHKTLAAIDAKGAIAPKGYTKCADYETWAQSLPPDAHSSTD